MFRFKIVEGQKKIVLQNVGGSLKAPCSCCCSFLSFLPNEDGLYEEYKYAHIRLNGTRTTNEVLDCWTTVSYSQTETFNVSAVAKATLMPNKECGVICDSASGNMSLEKTSGGSGIYCEPEGSVRYETVSTVISNCLTTSTRTIVCGETSTETYSGIYQVPIQTNWEGLQGYLRIVVPYTYELRTKTRNRSIMQPFYWSRDCADQDPAFLDREFINITGDLTTDIILSNETIPPNFEY